MHQLTHLAIAREAFWTSMTVNGAGRGGLSMDQVQMDS